MSAGIVVGYTATEAGNDALTLAARFAKALGAHLHLVIVLPREGTRSAVVPPERSYEDYLRREAQGWLREAAKSLPKGIAHSGHVRFEESFASGLVNAAEEFAAGVIVVGAANGGLLGRHRLGTVASELLHSSSVPVALAPAGTAQTTSATDPITRVTAAVGERPGAEALLEASVRLSTPAEAPLRLISLVTMDLPAGLDTGAIRIVDQEHTSSVLETAKASLPAELTVQVESSEGGSIEEAVTLTTWEDTEIALVGSSRLAQPRRLFLGSTAAKMLRELPVPLVVVPRESRRDEA